MKRSELAHMIDHTLLKPESTRADVDALAKEAGELGTYSICVSPSMLPVDTPAGVHVATVIGFPSGAVKTSVKVAEARQAVADGADEVDMVQNIGWAKEHKFAEIEEEIRAVKGACGSALLKVILETATLSDEEIVACCTAAEKAGADFVKTSTGFHPAGGASVHAVSLMSETVGGRLGVKASGGIRDAETALAMVDAGATRLGLSSSKKVLDGLT
ncbi:deoxyribose-phosphate aldolase [Corynebacterium pyruviciproducens]|uniref:deoxyribose-phosphate aldolase n=1 Tax=Corynebacterium pyruviciproducens TaxID=598660 RepID=UPI0024584153|nr:deoxyribose-phosphate aldolase [Corynebacterium pyruviciproducens]MDH4658704.1 deoxyribose-phosphate aldolase [Corynebacterium pyruviciproducens]